MREQNLDAIIVLGDETPNICRDYLTNRNRTNTIVVKKQGELPVLIASPLDSGEAEKTGLKVYTTFDLGAGEVREKYADNPSQLDSALLRGYLEKLEVK